MCVTTVWLYLHRSLPFTFPQRTMTPQLCMSVCACARGMICLLAHLCGEVAALPSLRFWMGHSAFWALPRMSHQRGSGEAPSPETNGVVLASKAFRAGQAQRFRDIGEILQGPLFDGFTFIRGADRGDAVADLSKEPQTSSSFSFCRDKPMTWWAP